MMLLRFLWRRVVLLASSLRAHFLRSLFSSLGLFISLLIVCGILGILRPLKNQVVRKIEGALPAEMVRVQPVKRPELNPVDLLLGNQDVALGIPMSKIRVMRGWSEISDVYFTQILQRPALTRMTHPVLAKIGGGLSFDIMIQGVSREVIRDYLKCMRDFRVETGGSEDGGKPLVPLIVPETYAEVLYAYTMINGLPPVNIRDLLGIKLQARLGQSILGTSRGKPEDVVGRVCAFVPAGFITTVGAPIDWVRATNKRWGLVKASESYDQVFLKVKNVKNTAIVREKVSRLGLKFSSETGNYQNLFQWLNKLDYLFWGIAALLIFLSGIAMANSFMLMTVEKKYEFGLYLVFGASTPFLWFIIFLEGAFWGFLQSTFAVLISAQTVQWLQSGGSVMPGLQALMEGGKIGFDMAASEKFLLIVSATAFAGASALLPALFLLGRSTLSLVKKD